MQCTSECGILLRIKNALIHWRRFPPQNLWSHEICFVKAQQCSPKGTDFETAPLCWFNVFLVGFSKLMLRRKIYFAISQVTRLVKWNKNTEKQMIIDALTLWYKLSLEATQWPLKTNIHQLLLYFVEAFEVLCLPGSISVRVIKRYYTDKKIMLQDLHLSDFTCKGKIDPDNQNIWVFNLTTLSSCSTIHMVSAFA